MNSLPEVAIDKVAETIAVDTGLWLKGLIYGGPAEELVKMGMTGRLKLVTSEFLLGELIRVLRDDLQFSEGAIEQVYRFVRDCATILPDNVTPGEAPESRTALMDLARNANADAIAMAQDGSPTEICGIPVVRVI